MDREMTYQEIMALFNQGAAAGNYGFDSAVQTGGEGSGDVYSAQPSVNTNLVQMPQGSIQFDPETGTYQLAQGDMSTNGYIDRSFFRPDGTITSERENRRSTSDKLKPLYGALGLMAGGYGLSSLGLLGGAGAAGGATAAAAAPTVAAGLTPEIAAAMASAGGAGAGLGGGGAIGLGGAMSGIGSAMGGIGSALASNPQLAALGLGAAAGALGGSQDETRTAESGLAPWQMPYAQDALSRANALSQRPYTPYGGEGVAGFNDAQQNAFGLVSQRANSGDPLVNSARDQQSNVIGGGMLGRNPYLDRVAQGVGDRMGEAYATGTRGAMASGAQMSGNDPRYSSAYQQTVGNADRAFGDSLGQTMNSLYMGNYRDERGAQDTASRASLGFSQDGRVNTEGLLNIGNQMQGNRQANNDFAFGQFQQQQAYPAQQLGILQNAINPAFGSQNQQTIPGVGPAQGALGGALAGAGIYRSLYPSARSDMQSGGYFSSMFPRG